MIPSLANKIVLAHAGFFDRNSRKIYRENSIEVCRESSKKGYIGIIELDLRKSKDGVLYCFHGNLFQYYFSLKYPRDYRVLQAKYRVNTLEEILEVIEEGKVIFLDIKDTKVSQEDILAAFKKKDFKEVILGNKSVCFLRRFSDMPRQYVKILNGNVLCNFYNLLNLRSDNFKYVEVVFPFQIRRSVIDKVKAAGIEFRCSGMAFLSKQSYWRKINAYGIEHVSSDFI